MRRILLLKFNELQKAVERYQERCQLSGILIVEARWVSVETEAALAAAETFKRKVWKRGFFGSPTQATAKSCIFSRIRT